MSKQKPTKIKLSLLRKWRDEVLEDVKEDNSERGYSDETMQAYLQGFIRGWGECSSTLNFQKIIDRVID